MKKFITLLNGDAIRADWIGAIRLGDADYLTSTIKPRVIVEFGYCEVSRHGTDQISRTIVYFDDNESRDQYAKQLLSEIEK